MVFSQEQAVFLKRELGVAVPAGKPANLSFDEWLDIKDQVFMIEADEAQRDGSLNERCRIAVSICDMSYTE